MPLASLITSRTISFSWAPSPRVVAAEEAPVWADLMAFVRAEALLKAGEAVRGEAEEPPSEAPGVAFAAPVCTPTTTIAATAARAAARRVFMWGVMRSPLLVPWGVTSGERATE